MNKNLEDISVYVRNFLSQVSISDDINVVFCPPFTGLQTLKEALRGSKVKMGAQNLFWEEKGSYTGEISPQMLVDVGCEYVIIGHSERRHILNETNLMINRKIKAALAAGLIPVLCIGEILRERKNNLALQVVKEQLTEALKDIEFTTGNLVIAYEPVWAIGTGINASCDDVQEMFAYIRSFLTRFLGEFIAESIPLLYGGSVNEQNIKAFLEEKDVDGALVGGASLTPESFARIVEVGQNKC